jgi:hypothetical protein
VTRPNALTLNMRGSILCASIVALVATAGAAQGMPVAFRTVASGADSQIDKHYALVARSGGTWRIIWFRHQGNSEPPQIDFRHEMVVALFAGRRATSEYALQIVSVTREEESLVVRYRVQVDAAKAMPPMARAPFHIIALPAWHAPVKFVEMRDNAPPAVTARGPRRP